MTEARQSLVLRFAVVSALIMAVLAVGFAHWSAGAIRASNIGRARTVSTFATNMSATIFNTDENGGSKVFAENIKLANKVLAAATSTGAFSGSTSWRENHQVVQSQDSRLTHIAPTRQEVDEAFRTQTVQVAVVSTVDPALDDPTESTLLAQHGALIEVFNPVRLGNLRLVVQTYAPWAPVQREIDKQTRTMLELLALGTLVLWVTLFRLVATASRRLRRQAADNWHLASHDALTGLPNRSLLADRVAAALNADVRSGRHTALLLLDLDRFQEVNDTLGHRYGDLLLKQIGPRLRPVLRDGDSISRLGGDEFVVLLRDLANAADAEKAADRLLRQLSEPFLLDEVTLTVEASIGIAVSPDHGADFDTLLQHADVGMYVAKNGHVGWSVYSPTDDAHSPARLALLGELRRAIEATDEIVLHFQPKADISSGVVTGVEALVRWQHPQHGLLFPDRFIPVAERTGLIQQLTLVVLDRALAQGRAWREKGLRLPVAVNLSPRCLLDHALPDAVSRSLAEHGMAADDLELEITESSVMADPQRAIEVLGRLHEIGVRLSIDDFGTGYSSMAYLKRLPVDVLKIDRVFVMDMVEDASDAAIVRSSVDLAHNLGLSVVAEGVETAEIWNRLDELGCDSLQGYFLARPMPGSQLVTWLETYDARPLEARVGA